MKRLRTILGLIALCGMAAFLTGCGDDDDAPPPNNNNNNNSSVAPSGLNGKTYTLVDAGTGAVITFSPDANTYSITKNGVTETGTFTAVKSGNQWVVDTTDSTGTITSRLELVFSGDGVGSYVYRTPSTTGTPVQGQFNASAGQTTTGQTTTGQTTTGQTTTGETTTGQTTTGQTTTGETTTGQTTTGETTTGQTTTGETTTGQTTTGETTTGQTTTGETTTGQTTTGETTTGQTTTGETTTGQTTTGQTTTGQTGTVQAPATAPLRLMVNLTQSVLGGGQYAINTGGGTSGNFTISDGGVGSGTYAYTPSGTTAHLVLTYTGEFQGDFDDMTLIFQGQPGSSTPSTVTGNQLAQPNQGPLAGTFTY